MVNLKLLDTGEILIVEGQSFPVELNSTAFSDVIPGSRIYEIKLPIEPNEAVLELSNYIEVNSKVKAYDVELLQEGIPKLLGKLNLRKFDNQFFHGSLTVNPFAQDIGTLSLKELPWPSDFLLGFTPSQIVAAAKTESQKLWPDANFAFPSIIAPNFYGSRPGDWGGIVNAYDSSAGQYFINSVLGEGEHNDNLYALCPLLYLRFILKIIFEENGYQLNGTWVTHELMQHALWFSNYALDKVPDETYFAEARNNSSQYIAKEVQASLAGLYFPIVVSDSNSCFSNLSGADPISLIPFNITQYQVKLSGQHVFKLFFPTIQFTPKPNNFEEGTLIDTITFTLRNTTQSSNIDTYQYINPDPCAGIYDFQFSLQGGGNPNDNFIIIVNREISYTSLNVLGNPILNTFQRDLTFYGGFSLEVRNAQYSTLNEYKGTVQYKNHVQDFKVSKFLLDIRDFFGLIYKFNYKQKIVTIDWCNDVLYRTPIKMAGPYAKQFNTNLEVDKGFTLKLDITENEEEIPSTSDHNYLGEFAGPFDAPSPKLGDMFYSYLYNTYYLAQLNDADTVVWYKKAWNYPEIILGDGSTQKTPGISPLLMDNGVMGGNNFLLPYYKEQGSSPVFEIGITEPKPKLVYYFGFQNTGGSHPFATSLDRLPDYSVHSLPRLTWDYHYRSIFMLKLKPWYKFLLNTKEVERQLLITDQEIEEYDFAVPELIDGVLYIRKQLLYEIANQWPNRARVTLLKL